MTRIFKIILIHVQYLLALLAFHKETLKSRTAVYIRNRALHFGSYKKLGINGTTMKYIKFKSQPVIVFQCMLRIRWDVLIIIFHHMLIQKI